MKCPFEAKPGEETRINVPMDTEAQRLDHFLVTVYPASSRSFFQSLINSGCIKVNGIAAKPSSSVRSHDIVMISLPERPERLSGPALIGDLSIKVLFEHADFIVIDKPAGLLVHRPHKNSTDVTLVDWLSEHYKELIMVGDNERPGIVHRLDKDTSGIMLIARTVKGHSHLSALFKDRMIHKTYTALVEGKPPASGSIDYRIDRHPTDPIKMAFHTGSGRDAQTSYKTLEYYNEYALVELKPVTGRTHQIRVHCLAIGHPLLGDATYGSSSKYIARHALHAKSISFTFDGEAFEFSSPLPADFLAAIECIRS